MAKSGVRMGANFERMRFGEFVRQNAVDKAPRPHGPAAPVWQDSHHSDSAHGRMSTLRYLDAIERP